MRPILRKHWLTKTCLKPALALILLVTWAIYVPILFKPVWIFLLLSIGNTLTNTVIPGQFQLSESDRSCGLTHSSPIPTSSSGALLYFRDWEAQASILHTPCSCGSRHDSTNVISAWLEKMMLNSYFHNYCRRLSKGFTLANFPCQKFSIWLCFQFRFCFFVFQAQVRACGGQSVNVIKNKWILFLFCILGWWGCSGNNCVSQTEPAPGFSQHSQAYNAVGKNQAMREGWLW